MAPPLFWWRCVGLLLVVSVYLLLVWLLNLRGHGGKLWLLGLLLVRLLRRGRVHDHVGRTEELNLGDDNLKLATLLVALLVSP